MIIDDSGTGKPVIQVTNVSENITIEGVTITGADGDNGGGLWVWSSVL